MSGLTNTVAPALEPVSLTEAKRHLFISGMEHDDYVTALIPAARQAVENFLNRQLITATWRQTFDEVPDSDAGFVLARTPLIAVSAIQYVDVDGATQTVSASDYIAYTAANAPYIGLAYDAEWPTARDQTDAVTVTFTAGYGPAASDVPAAIRQAILLLVGDMFENRMATVEQRLEANPAVNALLYPYRQIEL